MRLGLISIPGHVGCPDSIGSTDCLDPSRGSLAAFNSGPQRLLLPDALLLDAAASLRRADHFLRELQSRPYRGRTAPGRGGTG